jgi:hypothetical protein
MGMQGAVADMWLDTRRGQEDKEKNYYIRFSCHRDSQMIRHGAQPSVCQGVLPLGGKSGRQGAYGHRKLRRLFDVPKSNDIPRGSSKLEQEGGDPKSLN